MAKDPTSFVYFSTHPGNRVSRPLLNRSQTRHLLTRLRGVSLIELLVVIGIIALLLAMVLTGIQAAHNAYKRLEKLVGQTHVVDEGKSLAATFERPDTLGPIGSAASSIPSST